MSDAQKIVRVQLDMNPNQIQEIESLMSKTGVRTRKELFENAICLFACAVQKRSDGSQIGFMKNDNFVEFWMPSIERVKPQ